MHKKTRIFYCLITCLLCAFALQAQETTLLIDDFENGNKGWQQVDAGWVTIEIVDNPDKTGINTSDKVLKCVRKAGTNFWAGTILRNQAPVQIGVAADQYRYGHVKILKETNGNIGYKVERGGDANSYGSNAAYTPNGEWQEVVIDLGGAGGKSFTDFFIMPDQVTQTEQDITVYIDDVLLKTGSGSTYEETVLPGEFELVWADEFNDATYDQTIWSPQIAGDGFGNNELQYYTGNDKNIFTRDGNLVLKAYKETYQNRNYTSGKIWTRDKKNIKYGKVEARFKLPTGRGTWPAIWMMPKSSVYGGWPNSGEIDIMEYVGYDPNKVHGTVHRGAGSGSNGDGSNIVKSGMANDFHTIIIEWEPSYIKWYLDDELFHTYSNLGLGSAFWPFDQEFYLILNFAVGGDWGGAQGVDDSIWPQEFLIDYVRVYQKNGITVVQNPDADLFSVSRLDENSLLVTLNEFTGESASVEIVDISGKNIYQERTVENNLLIDISSFPKGIYMLKMSNNRIDAVKKIIK